MRPQYPRDKDDRPPAPCWPCFRLERSDIASRALGACHASLVRRHGSAEKIGAVCGGVNGHTAGQQRVGGRRSGRIQRQWTKVELCGRNLGETAASPVSIEVGARRSERPTKSIVTTAAVWVVSDNRALDIQCAAVVVDDDGGGVAGDEGAEAQRQC